MEVAQYLDRVLQASGREALPYAPDVRWTIREQLVELQKVFPTLGIHVDEYCATDGRCHNWLKAQGTIPVHYQGAKYNIPIVLWLVEHYPHVAPLAYVRPTNTMVIKHGHTYVDSSGQVAIPILRSWSFSPSNNLVEVILQMSHFFGAEPPLYSRQATSPAPPPPQQQQQQGGVVQPPPGYPTYGRPPPPQQPQPQASHGVYGAGSNGYPNPLSAAAGGYGAGAAAGAAAAPSVSGFPSIPTASDWGASGDGDWGGGAASSGPSASRVGGSAAFAGGAAPGMQQQQQPKPPPPPPPPPRAATRAEVEAVGRPLLLAALKLQLGGADRAYKTAAAAQFDDLLETQRQLNDRKRQLTASVNTLKQEREGTEGVVGEMGLRTQQLRLWLAANEAKVEAAVGSSGSELDIRKAIVPADAMSEQALSAQAEDLAIEDTILGLDKALQAGAAGLGVEAYLKQVRALCRRQFFARATGLKVAEVQAATRESGPPPIQAGMSLPYSMVHGDSWTHGAMQAQPPMR